MNKEKPFCILRHGRKSHTWGELRQASEHTMRDAPWLGHNIDLERSNENAVLAGTGDVVEDVRTRLASVGLEPKRGQVVAREILLTASSSFFAANGHSGRAGDFDQERLAAWRDASMAFLREEFGPNLCTVVLHLDEEVPHLHAWSSTAVHVEKKGRGRPRKDGVRRAISHGWTLNHDKVVGAGKLAFSTRQDRYAITMQPLGLYRGRSQSRAHHEPIRAYYARIRDVVAQAETERETARQLRLQAEQDAIRQSVLTQAAALSATKAKEQEQYAALILRSAEQEKETALFLIRQVEAEQRILLDEVKAERQAVAEQKQRMRRFLDDNGMGGPFDIFAANMQAVERLRNGKGTAWANYEKALHAYATDLRRYANLPNIRDILIRLAEKHLAMLLESGAQALGHASYLRSPMHLVSDGIDAWLQITGGEPLVMLHRTAVRLVREAWACREQVAMPAKQRGRER